MIVASSDRNRSMMNEHRMTSSHLHCYPAFHEAEVQPSQPISQWRMIGEGTFQRSGDHLDRQGTFNLTFNE